MQAKTESKPKTVPGAEDRSLIAMTVVLVLSNSWFVAQTLTYW
jgi:hypothetical protein